MIRRLKKIQKSCLERDRRRNKKPYFLKTVSVLDNIVSFMTPLLNVRRVRGLGQPVQLTRPKNLNSQSMNWIEVMEQILIY